jgi:hypothetical protein
MARNDVQVGIDRVKTHLKVNPRTGRPALYFFETVVNTIEELTTYRYPELKANESGVKAEKENPLKVNDHALDALRYFIVDLPEPTEINKDLDRSKKYTAAEIQLQDTIKALKQPKDKSDPWGDY